MSSNRSNFIGLTVNIMETLTCNIIFAIYTGSDDRMWSGESGFPGKLGTVHSQACSMLVRV